MNVSLRPYQVESIEGLRQGIREGHLRQILCAATGAGKSIIASKLVELHVEKQSRLCFVVDRRVLVDQFSNHLEKFGIDHGVWMASHWRWRPQALIQVCSVQTLEKAQQWPHCDTLIVDEAHAMQRKSLLNFIAARPNMKVVGLTATPLTKGLGKTYSNVVNVITMRQLVDQQFLVPFKVFVAKEIDVAGVKVQAGEWLQSELETRGNQIVGDVVADYIRISNQLWGTQKKTIVFSAGVDHAIELARKFSEIGKNAIAISYKDTDEYKQQVIADFSKPDTCIDVLISCDILTRGFDVPDVEHVIVAKPLRKSLSMHIQMLGRGARPYPGKTFCCVQDHSGNYLRFKKDWDRIFSYGIHHLNDDAEKPKKEPTLKEKEASKCPKCGSLWASGALSCAVCGYVRERRSMLEAVPGEMHELDGTPAAKTTNDSPAEWYAQLIGFAQEKGYKPAWAYFKMLDKFGDCPKVRPTPQPVTPKVSSWIRSQQIKYARRNQSQEARVR